MYEIIFSTIIDILILFCIYILLTLPLNFEWGYTGIFNLGIYFPMIVGAIITAAIPGRLAMMIYGIDSELDYIWDNAKIVRLVDAKLAADPLTAIGILAVTAIIVIVISAFLGYLSSYPALKLPLDYLALFTLCLAESTRLIGTYTDWMAGGPFGITVINPFVWAGPYSTDVEEAFIIGVTVVVIYIFHKLCNSPLGRALRAIRDNETTAECVGKDTKLIRRKVLMFASIPVGLAGMLHSLYLSATVVQGYTRVDFSYWPWMMMMIGGTANNTGVVVGTFILIIIRRLMIYLKHYFTFLPFSVLWVEPILLAIMLGIILAFRPEGIIPEKPQRIKLGESSKTSFKSEKQFSKIRILGEILGLSRKPYSSGNQ